MRLKENFMPELCAEFCSLFLAIRSQLIVESELHSLHAAVSLERWKTEESWLL